MHSLQGPIPNVRPIIGKLMAEFPLDFLAIDFTLLEKSSDGHENVLVMTDVCSKFSQAVPCRDQKASTVAKVLVKEWFQKYGVPRRIHSDQGRNFESQLVRDFIIPRETGNASGLIAPSTTYSEPYPQIRRDIGHSTYRSWYSSTGLSPFFVYFGQEPTLPIDLMFGLPDSETTLTADSEVWVKRHQQKLRDAATAALARMEEKYINRCKHSDAKANDRGLL